MQVEAEIYFSRRAGMALSASTEICLSTTGRITLKSLRPRVRRVPP